MLFISRGSETRERMELLLKLTKITSENMISAIIDHYVNGLRQEHAALLNGIKQQNLNRTVKRLNELAGVVEQIKEIDWKSASI